MFEKKVYTYILKEKLFDPKSDKVLVALSGGADSVALLRVLLKLGVHCEAAHCNFQLRGEESERDEAFVRSLCRMQNVPLEVKRFDTQAYAKASGVSIEMAARDLRYGWFEELRLLKGCRVIAVAHHANDSVETFLLNLVRGTGIRGLKGIAPKNGAVVRPLLCADRHAILNYLKQIEQPYVTDRTNLEDEYTRNKIRLHVVPQLEQINPSFQASLMETAARLSEVEAIYRRAMAEALERVSAGEGRMSIEKLRQEVSPQAVLYEWLYPLGFNASQLNDILQALEATSGRIFLTDRWKLLRDRTQLILSPRTEEEPVCRLHVERFTVDQPFQVPADRTKAYVDASRLNGPLALRKWQSGDRFMPYGMTCFKRVRDYLRDRKFSLFDKEKQLVVTSGDEIVWLVNERTDNRYRITPQTLEVVVLTVEE